MKAEIPQEGFFFDEAKHYYYLDGKRMTGVTTILGTINKPALVGWAARMACDYIRKNVAYAIPAEDGGYWAIKPSTVEEAQKAHAQKRDSAADDGTALHSLVEGYIKDCIAQGGDARAASKEDNEDEETLGKFIDWAQDNKLRFLASEQKFYSRSMFVAGTADFMFEKDGKRYVGDIKCKNKIWSREPMFQCAAYSLLAEEMGEKPFDGYCVIRLKDGELEEFWSMDVEGDRKAFMACVELYRALANWNK